MKKRISKYEYYEGPNSNYWKNRYRGAFGLPSPTGRLFLLFLMYSIIALGIIMLKYFPNKIYAALICIVVGILWFIPLRHNPLWFIHSIQLSTIKMKRSKDIFDDFIIKCNYFIDADKISTKINVEKINSSLFNAYKLKFVDKRKEKIILKGYIKKNVLYLKVFSKTKYLSINTNLPQLLKYKYSISNFNCLNEFCEYLYVIIKNIKKQY